MRPSLAAFAALSLCAVSACAGTTGPRTVPTTAVPDSAVTVPGTTPSAQMNLAEVCPSRIVIQTDWGPRAEQGFLYGMLGPDYTVDRGRSTVTAGLMASGRSTGVELEIRSGGAAIGYRQVTVALYDDPTVMLGSVGTAEAIARSADKPTLAVFAPMVKGPDMVMWDPATYPGVRRIADLKEIGEGVKIRHRDGVPWVEFLERKGLVTAKQLDGTQDESAAAFVAAGGREAQQGSGVSDPHIYSRVLRDWMKPIAYQYVDDAGWRPYAESIAGKPESVAQNAACLERLVPVMQRSQFEYVRSPGATNAVIVDAARQFAGGWVYDAGTAAAGAAQLSVDSLVGDGPDGTLGSFDTRRLETFIKEATTSLANRGYTPRKGLSPADLVTGRFLDPSISLG